jgi:hypothetical protein
MWPGSLQLRQLNSTLEAAAEPLGAGVVVRGRLSEVDVAAGKLVFLAALRRLLALS